MKRIIANSIMFICLGLSVSTVFAADSYALDPMHTSVLWHVNHFGFSNPSGKWMASGSLVLDEANPKNSQVNAVIDTGDIVTGVPELDKHLKGELFFDVSKYPTATFVSDKVDVVNKKTAKVHGILTLHGVSKPVILLVTLNKMGKNPISDKMSAGFSASTKIKRSDFGITTFIPGVGDEVTLNIEAEAYKK